MAGAVCGMTLANGAADTMLPAAAATTTTTTAVPEQGAGGAGMVTDVDTTMDTGGRRRHTIATMIGTTIGT